MSVFVPNIPAKTAVTIHSAINGEFATPVSRSNTNIVPINIRYAAYAVIDFVGFGARK